MPDETMTAEQFRSLAARLEEAEETLRAVHSGEIDAFIVQGPDGEKIYSLRNAEQPYRNLIEDMLEGAAILTTDGDIVYCNKRFAELVAVPLEEAVGGSMERFIDTVERPAYRALLDAGTGKRRTKLTTASGQSVDVLISFTTSICDDVERRNLLITDLSELLDAQSSRDRAEQQSQAKDEFMAMLAHELRNPLSAITAAVQVLESAKEHAQESAAARARFIIGRQAKHLARLVDDLLDVGRVVTGKIALERGTIDFSDLVRRTIAVFCERDSQHQFEVSTTPAWIEGDAVRIEQVVSNIVGNAVKYTPPGGNIRVLLTIEDDEAVLQVQDDGLGIAPELLPNVFDLFVQGARTLDRAQGGLGIGLTLARQLVSLHHGTVSVTSAGPDRGSVFTVRLPRVAAVVPSNDPGSSKSDGGAVRRRVLIVEDNRDAREMFRTMLELDGHEVLEADEGCSGLRLLESELPDIAFIDVGLPGLDGYEIARRFRGGRNAAKGARGGDNTGRALKGASAGDDTGSATKGASAGDGSGSATRGASGSAARGASAGDGASAKGARVGDGTAASIAGVGKSVVGAALVGAGVAGKGGDRLSSSSTTAVSVEDKEVFLVALTGYGTPDALERSRLAGFDHHLIKPVNPEALYKLMSARNFAHSGERTATPPTQMRTQMPAQSTALAPRATA